MALRIANNISAMNTQRWLGIADGGMKRSLERLSSGYRINKAADDAAGLAISQSFRANIASFKVASRNTSEASALLQVAEGGMDQIGNMLTRLKELATQASSANAGQSERDKIDAEGEALLLEIDRIANSSKYGSTALLDGTFGSVNNAGTMTGGSDDIRIFSDLTHVYSMVEGPSLNGLLGADLTLTGLRADQSASDWTFVISGGNLSLGNGIATENITGATTSGGASTVDFDASGAYTYEFSNLGITFTVTPPATGISTGQWDSGSLDIDDTGLTSLSVNNANTGVFEFVATSAGRITLGNGTITQSITGISPGTAQNLDFDLLGITFTIGTNYTEDDLEGVKFTVSSVAGGGGSTFQIGSENNTDNRISISIGGAKGSDLGLSDLDLSSSSNAQAALDLVDSAISSLASTRGNVGAYMNRLGYAAANLATTIENQQAAESVIRDVDMAEEMTTFTKNQILLQAGTAMLAQANMAPQQVLSLFG